MPDQIIEKLFYLLSVDVKTLLTKNIAVYQAVLPHFNKYVKLFQNDAFRMNCMCKCLTKQFFET